MPMKKVSVTYTAPPGDSKVVEMFGHTLYDGKAESIEVTERELEKLKGNKLFKCGEASDVKDSQPDPEKQKAEGEAAKREDEAKLAAQGGAKYPNVPEPSDDEKREAQKEPDRTRGVGGGAPDPNQPQGKKEKVPGEDDHGKAHR